MNLTRQNLERLLALSDEIRTLTDEVNTGFCRVIAVCDSIVSHSTGGTHHMSAAQLAALYSACAVHDIATQRLSKMERIIARMQGVPLAEDDPLLQGPQSAGNGMTQDDIDRLLKDMEA